ncbi:non-ribosomal peptide synthetase [Micromonospora craniellae]|uniref:Amino acid adenylation domain-containing protein n=1 Tax=Micromonospora craniellae TaxID=2294034 RepID=A0A372FYD7_9ACTN|nr:non-ribosomal peptide synthetase [Micromonospora craniellae]QOC93359.1 amino acid adenylation domain-containing protein [Micromonospora craniellae]RFS45805.1 amino acid adenylation domain-containing protein [Micromonospora craniellae]
MTVEVSRGPLVAATLAADDEVMPGLSFRRGEATRALDVTEADLTVLADNLGTTPAAVLAAATQALVAGDRGRTSATTTVVGVIVADTDGVALRAVHCAVEPELPLRRMAERAATALPAARPATDGEVRIAVVPLGALGGGLDPGDVADLEHEIVWCDAVLEFTARDGRLVVRCDHDEDRYGQVSVAAHLDRLDEILTALVAGTGHLPGAGGTDPVTVAVDSLPTSEPVEPATPTERLLAAVWADVLHLDRVGADDNFFALGGHSLLAAKVVARTTAERGVALTVDQIFAHPVLADFAALVDAGEPAVALPALTAHTGDPVVSFGQERLWYLDRLRDGSALYNVPVLVRLTGTVDPERLHDAVRAVVAAHPALRTALATVDGRPVARTADPAEIDWTVSDARAGGEREGRRLAAAGVARPFDLAQAPLLRGGLVRIADDQWLLWLSVHHAACDGWSLDILLAEIFGKEGSPTNASCSKRDPSSLAPTYADYAAWQREVLTPQVIADEVAWWRQRLAGAPRLLELPADRRRPAVASHAGATLRHRLHPSTVSALRAAARSHSVTVFDLLVTAYLLLVGRWSGRTDVLVATPSAGRPLPELDDLVGFFVNTVVLRADLSGAPTFRDLVDRVRAVSAAAQAHQQIPFASLVDALDPDRDQGRAPLAQVAFGMNQHARGRWESDGLVAELDSVDTGTAKFDLTLAVVDTGGPDLGVEVEYATDLFDESTADRFAVQWTVLLERLLADVDAPITSVSALPAEEERRLLDWAGQARDYPAESTVDELVAGWAVSSPDAVAVVDGDLSVSYGSLVARADALAARLAGLGVGRGSLVGLCCRRSADLVVGMLGVLRAGGAYVPLDPDYPAQRLEFMLTDTDVRVVVGHRDPLDRFPLGDRHAVALPEAAGEVDPIARADLRSARGGDDAAYVIYTSGSTGDPKGVVVPHRGITRLVGGADYVELTPRTVLAQLANASFDAITFEVWGALANGGQVVIVPTETVLSPPGLAALLRTRSVTTVFITTALFNATVNTVPDAFATVDQLYFGGESLDPGTVGRVVEGGQGPARLHNIYGPTEVTTFATYTRLTARPTSTGAIGTAIGNTWAYVVDDGDGLAGVGVPGELWLGGPGVAWGYWDRPGLTADRFVPDGFSGVPGARLYRTGDVVFRRPDGSLEFVGRADHQVKVRGFRVELGEVESALLAYPAVASAVVVAARSDGAPVRLVGYVEPAAGAPVSVAGLREFLAERLPEHAVPSVFVVMDALPLTPNGKIDRAALPDPDTDQRVDQVAFRAPADPLEQIIAATWGEVLDVAEIGLDDNFFGLGGHSLHAVQVCGRLERTLRTPVSVRHLVEQPTVADLARRLRAEGPDAGRIDQIAAVVVQVRRLSPTERAARLGTASAATKENTGDDH